MNRTVSLSLCALLALACGPSGNDTVTTGVTEAEPTRRLEPRGTVTTADGIEMIYEAMGEGDTTLLLVHCWACDREFWREQVGPFSENYQVVTLDLPGHGESGAERESWSIAGLAEDVVTVIDTLELERVILVGHSMGGPVALLTAPLAGDRVIGVVAIDTVHNADMEWSEEAAAPIIAAYQEDFQGSNQQFASMLFPPDADQDLVAWVAERGNQTNPEAAIALMADFPKLDLAQALTEAGVPIRGVNAAALGMMIPETAVETNRKYADYDASILEGVGHYLMLEKPEEFNALLAAAVAELDAPKASSVP